jgi:hypothetical protein
MKSPALKAFFLNVPLSPVNGRVAITQEVSALKNKKIRVVRDGHGSENYMKIMLFFAASLARRAAKDHVL